MKKILLAAGLTFLIALNPVLPSLSVTPLTIQASGQVDFDQGNLSDEEYVKEIIKQFADLDLIHMETKNEDDLTPYQAEIDFKTLAMMTITEGEFAGTIFSYEDGKTAKDVQSEIKMMKSIYSDNQKDLDDIAKDLEGKYIVTDYPELKGQISQIKQGMLELIDELEEFYKEGKLVSAYTPQLNIADLDGGADLVEFYGQNASIKQGLIIDTEAATLTLETIVDIDEEELKTRAEDEGIGLDLSEVITDSTSRVVLSPGSQEVPTLKDLDTISQEELNKLLEEKRIEALY